MVDAVLVSLRDGKGFSTDLEIPAREPFATLAPKLVEILRQLNPPFAQHESLVFVCGGRPIAGGETLLQAGVWDGAVIVVKPG